MSKTRLVPNHAALLLENNEKFLVMTDLHIGFENELRKNQVYISSDKILESLTDEIKSLVKQSQADNIVLLGDIKAGIERISKAEWDSVPNFLNQIKQHAKVHVVPGNHDGNLQRLLPDDVIVSANTGMVLEDTLLTHGHTVPPSSLSYITKIIMGHIHPVFSQESSVLDGKRIWITTRIEKKDLFPHEKGELELVVMPSFNSFFHSSIRRNYKRSISPIIQKITKFNSAKIVTLDGSIIGDESSITSVL